jgi:tripartite-type tricarboxylate transporter receptor subunit TctC
MFGTAGTASSSHMAMENFKLATNLNMSSVPYKGAPPIVTDLIGGHIDMSFLFATPTTLAHIQNKDFVPLAVNAKSRLPALKNVPTFEESGIKLLPNLTWMALFKAGVWQDNQLQQVQAAMVRVMSDSKLSEPYRQLGLVWTRDETVPGPNWIEQQRQSFAPLVKNINLQE